MTSPSKSFRDDFQIAVVALLTAIVLGASLIIYLRSSIDASLRGQRKRLLDAVALSSGRQTLVAFSDQILSRSGAAATKPVDQLPEELSDVGIYIVDFISAPDKSTQGLVFWCGGADNHFGLVVTRDATGEPASPWPIRRQIGPRIWYYDELAGFP